MKKLLSIILFASLLLLNKESKAQWVTIPDAAFVAWLTTNYPSAMSGSMMDTTNSSIVNSKSVNCSNLTASDLTGIEYFDNLDTLNYSNNYLFTLPAVSNTVRYINASNCSGAVFFPPKLPSALEYLDCSGSAILGIDSILPNLLKYLNCSNCNISIPMSYLPDSLKYLDCSNDMISTLPDLKNLLHLNCSNNNFFSLPDLKNLQYLDCSNNLSLTCLPDLKNLTYLVADTGVGVIECIPNTGHLTGSWLTFLKCAVGNNLNGCLVLCNSYYTTNYDTLLNTFILTVDTAVSNHALSYHWDFGDGGTSTAPAPTHVYAIDTVYNVCLQVHNTAGDSCIYCHTIGKDYLGNIIKTGGFSMTVKNEAASTTIGINESAAPQVLKIYPNPAKELLVISYPLLGNTIHIYDMLGREVVMLSVVEASKNKIIDVSKLTAGVYFLKLTDTKGNVSNAKFVKQ